MHKPSGFENIPLTLWTKWDLSIGPRAWYKYKIVCYLGCWRIKPASCELSHTQVGFLTVKPPAWVYKRRCYRLFLFLGKTCVLTDSGDHLLLFHDGKSSCILFFVWSVMGSFLLTNACTYRQLFMFSMSHPSDISHKSGHHTWNSDRLIVSSKW